MPHADCTSSKAALNTLEARSNRGQALLSKQWQSERTRKLSTTPRYKTYKECSTAPKKQINSFNCLQKFLTFVHCPFYYIKWGEVFSISSNKLPKMVSKTICMLVQTWKQLRLDPSTAASGFVAWITRYCIKATNNRTQEINTTYIYASVGVTSLVSIPERWKRFVLVRLVPWNAVLQESVLSFPNWDKMITFSDIKSAWLKT